MIRDTEDGRVPDIARRERAARPGSRCAVSSPGGSLICTRPSHSRLTLHAAGTGSMIAGFWADSEVKRG